MELIQVFYNCHANFHAFDKKVSVRFSIFPLIKMYSSVKTWSQERIKSRKQKKTVCYMKNWKFDWISLLNKITINSQQTENELKHLKTQQFYVILIIGKAIPCMLAIEKTQGATPNEPQCFPGWANNSKRNKNIITINGIFIVGLIFYFNMYGLGNFNQIWCVNYITRTTVFFCCFLLSSYPPTCNLFREKPKTSHISLTRS